MWFQVLNTITELKCSNMQLCVKVEITNPHKCVSKFFIFYLNFELPSIKCARSKHIPTFCQQVWSQVASLWPCLVLSWEFLNKNPCIIKTNCSLMNHKFGSVCLFRVSDVVNINNKLWVLPSFSIGRFSSAFSL